MGWSVLERLLTVVEVPRGGCQLLLVLVVAALGGLQFGGVADKLAKLGLGEDGISV